MGMFSKIKEAQYSDGGNYLKPGVYRLQVKKVTSKQTRKGPWAYIVEFSVLESSNTDHLPGSEVTWMVTMDKEPALGNIKQFIATAAGTTDLTQVDEESAELSVSEAQPLAEAIVRASGVNITTRKGTPFTKVKFILDDAGSAGAAAEHAKNQ